MIYIESDPTSYLEHVRDQNIDGIRFIAAIFNWKHSTIKNAQCLVRIYIRPDNTCTVLLSGMRFSGGRKYQPSNEKIPLINKLYRILQKQYGIHHANTNWIGHYGNFSEFEHELVPDSFFHIFLLFEGNEFFYDTQDKSTDIPRWLIHEHIPLDLEPGASLIESLGWGDYPLGWS